MAKLSLSCGVFLVMPLYVKDMGYYCVAAGRLKSAEAWYSANCALRMAQLCHPYPQHIVTAVSAVLTGAPSFRKPWSPQLADSRHQPSSHAQQQTFPGSDISRVKRDQLTLLSTHAFSVDYETLCQEPVVLIRSVCKQRCYGWSRMFQANLTRLLDSSGAR